MSLLRGDAAEALRESIGSPVPPDQLERHRRGMERARASLSEQAFASAWETGKLMPLEQAIACALQEPETNTLPNA
jgi:hypothetical protein